VLLYVCVLLYCVVYVLLYCAYFLLYYLPIILCLRFVVLCFTTVVPLKNSGNKSSGRDFKLFDPCSKFTAR
jgi:hypothetical protein